MNEVLFFLTIHTNASEYSSFYFLFLILEEGLAGAVVSVNYGD
jgi:hypothetical protein